MLLQPNIVEILEPELDQFLLKNCLIILIIIITHASTSSQNLQIVRESIKTVRNKKGVMEIWACCIMTMACGSGSSATAATAAAAACAVKLAFFLSSCCKAIHLWGANCKWEGNLRKMEELQRRGGGFYTLHCSRPGGVLGCDKWMKKHLNKAGEPLVRMSEWQTWWVQLQKSV